MARFPGCQRLPTCQVMRLANKKKRARAVKTLADHDHSLNIRALSNMIFSLKLEGDLFMMGGMKTIMKLEDLTTIDQLTDFQSSSRAVDFPVISNKDAGYCRIQGKLAKHRSMRLSHQG